MIPIPYADENAHPESVAPVLALVLANALVFYGWHSPRDFLRWGFVPADPQPWRWLTSQFLHAGPGHIIGNMWALWLFGDNLAARLGKLFLPFYLLGGVAANAAHLGLHPGSAVPAVGASGAVCAVIGAYAVLFPGARLKCFRLARLAPGGMTFSMSALVWGALYLASQILAASGMGGRGVAYGAHIGGLLFGAAAGLLARALAPGESPALVEGLGLQPDFGGGRAGAVREALAAGQSTRAAGLFARALREDPYFELPEPAAQLAAAEALRRAGHPHLARAALERFLLRHRADPAAPDALVLLGYLEQACFKEFAAAARLYEEAAAHPKAGPARRQDAQKRLGEARAALSRDAPDAVAADSPCAVLLESAPPLSAAGRATVARILETSPASGVLARGLPGPRALRAAGELERSGVHVLVVPEDKLVALAPAAALDDVSADAAGLSHPGGAVPWGDILFLCAYGLRPARERRAALLEVAVGSDVLLEDAPARPLLVFEALTENGRLRWACDEPGRFFSVLREAVAAASGVPLDLGARAAHAGRMPDALLFDEPASAEAYVFWQAQLARLKRGAAYG